MTIVTLTSNANRSKQSVVVTNGIVSHETLRDAAKNKLKMKAVRFFAEGGHELVDGDSLTKGMRVLCSSGEEYVGALYQAPLAVATAASAPVHADVRAEVPSVSPSSSPAFAVERLLLPKEKGEIAWLRVGAGRLALWHKPGGKAHAKLRDAGATRVVTLLAEREGAETIGANARAAGLEWDWHALDGADAEYLATDEAVSALVAATVSTTRALRSGASVLVHCSAGVHRTGTVGYAVLRASGGFTAHEATAALGAMRAVTGQGVDHAGPGRAEGGGRLALAERRVVPAAQAQLLAPESVCTLQRDREPASPTQRGIGIAPEGDDQ